MKKLTQAQRKRATRLALIHAAGKVLVEKGYANASIDLIAAAAGYTKGAVYAHFANKEALLYGVIKHRSDAIRYAIEHSATDNDVLAELLIPAKQKKLVGAWFTREKWLLLMLEYVLFMQRHPKSKAKFRRLLKADQQQMAKLIASRYAAKGATPSVPVMELVQRQQIVDLGFGLSKLIDHQLPESIYRKLLRSA